MAGRGRSAGAVRIDILASRAEFRKAMRENRTILQRFGRAARDINKKLQRSWKSVTATVGAFSAAMLVGVKSMAAYSAKVVEVSRNVGTTTKTLEGFRALMVGDGLNVRQADKALEAFNRRIGQARQGVGEARRALEGLGVSLQTQTGAWKSNDALLKEVSEKLHTLGDEQLAAAHAADLFSDVGKRMVATLISAGASYEQALAAAGRYHTLTQEQHETNKKLDQKFTDFKANIDDFKNRVLANFAPEIETVVNNFNNWLGSLKDNKTTIENFAKGVLKVADALGTVAAIVVGMKAGGMVGSLLPGVGGAIGAGVGALGGYFAKRFATGELSEIFGEMTRSPAEQALHLLLSNTQYRNLEGIEGHGMTDRQRKTLQGFRIQENLIRSLIKAEKTQSAAASASASTGGGGGSSATTNLIYGGDAKGFMGRLAISRGAWLGGTSISPATTEGSIPGTRAAREEYEYNRRRIAEERHRRRFGRFDSAGHRAFAFADLGSMSSLYGMQLAQIKASALAYGGAGLDSVTVGSDMLDPTVPIVGARGNTSRGLKEEVMRARTIATASLMSAIRRDAEVVASEFDIVTTAPQIVRNLAGGVGADPRDFRINEWLYNRGNRRRLASTWGGDAGGFSGRIAISRGSWLGQTALTGRASGITDTGAPLPEAVLRRAQEYEDALRKAAQQTQDIENSLTNWADGVLNNFTNLRDAIENLLADIGRLIIRKMITEPMAASASTWLSGLFSGLFSMGGGGGGARSAAISGWGGPAAADGGMVRGMTLVGERGPELVDFSRPGMVYTTEQLGQALSGNGGGITIVNNINSTDGPGVRKALGQAMPAIVNAAQARVADQARRPGAFRNAVRGT